MDKTNVLLDQISSLMAAVPADDIAGVVKRYWEPLKHQLTFLVGEEGFESLFTRSLFVTRHAHAGLDRRPSLNAVNHLAEFALNLSHQAPAEAVHANAVLLCAFIDLLCSLIGEALTINILRLAWGDDALVSLGKEQQQ